MQLTESMDRERCIKINLNVRQSLRLTTQVLLLATRSPRSIFDCSTFADTRVVPAEDIRPEQEREDLSQHDNCRIEGARHGARHCSGRSFQFPAILYQQAIQQALKHELDWTIHAGKEREPTEEELDLVEGVADAHMRASFRTRHGKYMVIAEHKQSAALFKYMQPIIQKAKNGDDDRIDARLRCTKAALPYVYGGGAHGLIEIRDLNHILHDDLQIERSVTNAESEETVSTLCTNSSGFVLLRDLVDWYASFDMDHRIVSTSMMCRYLAMIQSTQKFVRSGRLKLGRRLIQRRERSLCRSELWCSLCVNSKLGAQRRILRQCLLWQTLGSEREALKLRLFMMADSSSRLFLRSGTGKNHLRWESFHCAALETQFRAAAKSCTQPRLAATKQAELAFHWFDIGGDGTIKIDMLGPVLRRFGILLSPSELIIATHEIAGSSAVFKWIDLQNWLLACTWPAVHSRMARGWRPCRRKPRRDAVDRIFVAGRHQALAQMDLMLSLESKWCTTLHAEEFGQVLRNADFHRVPDMSKHIRDKPFDALLQSALEFQNVYYRQRVGPFDSSDSNGGASDAVVEGGKNYESHPGGIAVHRMLAHAECAIDDGVKKAFDFAQEYCCARLFLKHATDGGKMRVVYDREGSKSPANDENYCVRESKSEQYDMPLTWYSRVGKTRLAIEHTVN